MSCYQINGGTPLRGRLAVQGAKNSVLPILAAALLAPGESVIHNCPDLSDVTATLDILRLLSCGVSREGDTVALDARELDGTVIPASLMGELRSSVIFLGALLTRMGEVELSYPGGCELGPRPIDLHLGALRQLGAEIREEGGFLHCRAPRLRGIGLDEACRMTLAELTKWVDGVPASLPEAMRPMAASICQSFQTVARRLMDLGLGYLTLDRSAATLSTGERQRMQLARAVRNRTTGVLYVLDEPSIGLHPSNITGLTAVMDDLVADGNSVLLVDHDTQILSHADWIIEMGPEAGARGGQVVAQGTVRQLEEDPASRIGPFLSGRARPQTRRQLPPEELFAEGRIRLATDAIHTVKPLEVDLPKGRLTVVTGVSGSGKTTLILESLVPGLEALTAGKPMPPHVRQVTADGIERVKLIDATPIGINIRSTVATYAGVHDELRKIYARSPEARALGYKAGDFSYNTGKLRCPTCDGTGAISLDVQFLPDVDIPCPDCRGSRYSKDAGRARVVTRSGAAFTLPELMAMDIHTALDACADWKVVRQRLRILEDLGLGYLTLGEDPPSLSGGEAQRLKLASEMGRGQGDTVFVFDEPTIGLHPLDVQTLLGVFRTLIDSGATVVVIEHDLDVIRSADFLLDMGPGGGEEGGRIVALGTPEQVAQNPDSVTGRYLR